MFGGNIHCGKEMETTVLKRQDMETRSALVQMFKCCYEKFSFVLMSSHSIFVYTKCVF